LKCNTAATSCAYLCAITDAESILKPCKKRAIRTGVFAGCATAQKTSVRDSKYGAGREGVGTIINNQPDMSLSGTASNGTEGIEAFRALRPDVTLMDLRLPDLSGLDVTIAIRSEFPHARIIVLTTFEGDIDVQRALKAGVRGYLLKSMPPQQMLDAIRQVHAGKKYIPAQIAAGLAEYIGEGALSERELEVLQQVATGHRNREIGAKLFIAEETVKAHMKHIMDKLNARDRTQSVAIAVRRGMMQL
jgi:DNA-binding NarL/FixJ family response regulator